MDGWMEEAEEKMRNMEIWKYELDNNDKERERKIRKNYVNVK